MFVGKEKEVSANISSFNLANLESHILGKILTILDASITDKEQRDALKMLIKQSVWQEIDVVVKWMEEQKDGNSSTFPY